MLVNLANILAITVLGMTFQMTKAYLNEELSYGALLGPFDKNPIEGGHSSPFIMCTTPNADRRHVIVDLSWPQGCQSTLVLISHLT